MRQAIPLTWALPFLAYLGLILVVGTASSQMMVLSTLDDVDGDGITETTESTDPVWRSLGTELTTTLEYDLVHTTDTLSQARRYLSATSVGKKLMFAGGWVGPGSVYSDVVDIYDADTETWSTATLSQAREDIAATTVGNKVIFATGYYAYGGGFSDVVDIYDANTGLWSTTTVSPGRQSTAAATVGNQAMIAGGWLFYDTDVVNIYNADTDTWSTSALSQARHDLVATTVGNKAIFAGGRYGSGAGIASAVVDIYDADTDTWSTATLSQARYWLAATTVGNKAIFAGGHNPFGKIVDIYDADTDTWSTAMLSQERSSLAATTVGNKAIFAGGLPSSGVVDIYDADTDTWSTATFSQARYGLAATTVGNQAMFGGGFSRDGNSDRVDIYTTPQVSQPVAIDIEPWSDRNSINPMSRHLIPVALLGSDTFDVADVDVTTLAFGSGSAEPALDLTHPFVYWLSHWDVNLDGEKDLISFYRTEDTGIAFGDTEACLTGETLDGIPFEGCDAVSTTPGCGLGVELALLLPPLMWLWRRRSWEDSPEGMCGASHFKVS